MCSRIKKVSREFRLRFYRTRVQINIPLEAKRIEKYQSLEETIIRDRLFQYYDSIFHFVEPLLNTYITHKSHK